MTLTPHPSPIGRGVHALIPHPLPIERGEIDSLSLRERARVREKFICLPSHPPGLAPATSPAGRGAYRLPSPLGRRAGDEGFKTHNRYARIVATKAPFTRTRRWREGIALTPHPSPTERGAYRLPSPLGRRAGDEGLMDCRDCLRVISTTAPFACTPHWREATALTLGLSLTAHWAKTLTPHPSPTRQGKAE